MTWNNVHKWIIRHMDDSAANLEEFQRYAELESLECSTSSGNSVFHLAVVGKSSSIVKYLIDKAPQTLINRTNDNFESPLHWACYSGNINTITLLLESGAHIDTKDQNGNTPLHFAVEAGNYNAVKLLVCAGSDINETNDDDLSVLDLACVQREMKIIRILVEKGANCYSVLSHYVALNDSQIVKNLLKSIDPSLCVDKFNHNPLHVAVIHNRYKMAKILANLSSSWISEKNRAGKTPADLLRSYSDKRLRILLLPE